MNKKQNKRIGNVVKWFIGKSWGVTNIHVSSNYIGLRPEVTDVTITITGAFKDSEIDTLANALYKEWDKMK